MKRIIRLGFFCIDSCRVRKSGVEWDHHAVWITQHDIEVRVAVCKFNGIMN